MEKAIQIELLNNQITIEARIVSVADAIEAMSSDRPYRKARSTEYILKELQRCSNTQFDPLVASTAMQILKEMESAKHTEEAIEYAKASFKIPQPNYDHSMQHKVPNREHTLKKRRGMRPPGVLICRPNHSATAQ